MSGLREIQPSYRAVYYVPISLIHSRPVPPRGGADGQKLLELAASIRQHGLLQPITVRAAQNGYEIVLGERRFRACVMLGFSYIDAFVLNAAGEEATLYALLENKDQEALHFLDEAAAYAAMSANGISAETISRQVGTSAEEIGKKLRLLSLTPEVRQLIRESALTDRHARALLSVRDAEKQMSLARQTAKLRLTPQETEALAAKAAGDASRPVPKRKVISVVWEPRLYLNAIYGIIRRMREAGLETQTNTAEDDGWITLNVRIRKQK